MMHFVGIEGRFVALSLVVLIVVALLPEASHASITVEEHIFQQGLFVKSECKPETKQAADRDADENFDACACEADVRYPQVSGMDNVAAEASINSTFKDMAQQAKCEGDAMPKPASGGTRQEKDHASVSQHYELSFQSDGVLGLKFTDWAYTGGAHGNGSVMGFVIDLKSGRVLSLNDLIAVKNMDAVNQAIYDILAAKPEGEVFRDQVESRKGAFINKGECQGCTLVMTPDGVHVVFQTYEVAPYAAGNLEVAIPAEYIANAAVREALAKPQVDIPKKSMRPAMSDNR